MLNASYGQIFELEMDGWCYGIESYPGEIFPALVHAVIKDLAPCFISSLENGYVFSVLALADKFSKASKFTVHAKEIAFSILAQFPHPNTLNEEGKYTLAQVIDEVEQAHGGALDRLQRKWSSNKQAA